LSLIVVFFNACCVLAAGLQTSYLHRELDRGPHHLYVWLPSLYRPVDALAPFFPVRISSECVRKVTESLTMLQPKLPSLFVPLSTAEEKVLDRFDQPTPALSCLCYLDLAEVYIEPCLARPELREDRSLGAVQLLVQYGRLAEVERRVHLPREHAHIRSSRQERSCCNVRLLQRLLYQIPRPSVTPL
jgi:hypothetical protein